MLAFLVLDVAGGERAQVFKQDYLVLHSSFPALHEFFTYQFIHGGLTHLLGNMLFLWIFGNAVNAKMGDVAYVLFYLASGVFAGYGFSMVGGADLLGASGSISGVTAAYLALFPSSRVTVLYWFFFIGTFELPAMIMIGLKIILWDNVVAPHLSGPSYVAVEAHLAGYFLGFAATMVMLLLRVLPRDQFDILALAGRWHRRRTYRRLMADPDARAFAQHGRLARPVSALSPQQRATENARLDQISDLRLRVADCLERGDVGAATTLHEQLVAVDPNQCLSARHQMAVAREYYGTGRYAQAAASFEQYVKSYGDSPEAQEVHLLVGIIYARDLRQYEAAERHLERCRLRLTDQGRREQCTEWLATVRSAMGKPALDG